MEEAAQTTKSYYKETVAQIESFVNTFNKEIKEPYCKFYSTLHTDMTKVKKDYILDNLNRDQRLAALAFLTVSTAFLSRKLLRRSLMSTLKISIGTYFGSGLFICPEVYNPIFCIQGHRYNCDECDEKDFAKNNLDPKSQ